MALIQLETLIKARQEIVFDLARSIDFQSKAVTTSSEKAVAGRTSGLISLGETVTYQGKHLGVKQNLTTRVTEYERPHFFVDEMVQGAFKSIRHEHYFFSTSKGILMKDTFIFEAPFGVLGSLANKLFLKAYMTNFLKGRNRTLKVYAESDKWKEIFKDRH